jgi:hypothetical protein
LTPALLLLALGAIDVHIEPVEVTLGKDADARIDVVVHGADGKAPVHAKLRLTTSVGEISSVKEIEGGHFRAQFIPPKERFPQVALLLAEAEIDGQQSRRWLALPLRARATLDIETKPRATVTVAVGNQNLGPAVANAKGRLSLPAIVPPGLATANVRAVDRAGNSTVKPLDLKPTPYARVRSVFLAGWASWSLPAEIEVFAVEADGKPLADAATLKGTAKLGALSTPEPRGEGVFIFRYQAPDDVRKGHDDVTIALNGWPIAENLGVSLRPGAPVKVALSFSPNSFVAGSSQPVHVEAAVVDAHGNVVPSARATLSTDIGTVESMKEGDVIRLPDSFAGKKEATVQAKTDVAVGVAVLPLKPAAVASDELTLDRDRLRAGEPLEGRLVLRDRFGNPVEGAHPDVLTPAGRKANVEDTGGGMYLVHLAGSPDDPPGPMTLEVQTAGASLGHSPEIVLLHYERPWAVSVGLALSGQSNFNKADSLAPRLTFGLRLGQTPVEIILDVEGGIYSNFTSASAINESGCTCVGGSLKAFAAAAGVRYWVPLTVNFSLQLSVVAGAQRNWATFSIGTAEQPPPFTVPLIRGAAGVSYYALAGRFALQLEYTYAGYVSAPASDNTIEGNLRGVGLALGYLINF